MGFIMWLKCRCNMRFVMWLKCRSNMVYMYPMLHLHLSMYILLLLHLSMHPILHMHLSHSMRNKVHVLSYILHIGLQAGAIWSVFWTAFSVTMTTSTWWDYSYTGLTGSRIFTKIWVVSQETQTSGTYCKNLEQKLIFQIQYFYPIIFIF